MLKTISGLEDIDHSSVNPDHYQAECKVENCFGMAITSYPFCCGCLSKEHGLRVSQSTPRVGLGLFVDQDFDSGHILNLTYGDSTRTLDQEAYDAFIEKGDT